MLEGGNDFSKLDGMSSLSKEERREVKEQMLRKHEKWLSQAGGEARKKELDTKREIGLFTAAESSKAHCTRCKELLAGYVCVETGTGGGGQVHYACQTKGMFDNLIKRAKSVQEIKGFANLGAVFKQRIQVDAKKKRLSVVADELSRVVAKATYNQQTEFAVKTQDIARELWKVHASVAVSTESATEKTSVTDIEMGKEANQSGSPKSALSDPATGRTHVVYNLSDTDDSSESTGTEGEADQDGRETEAISTLIDTAWTTMTRRSG